GAVGVTATISPARTADAAVEFSPEAAASAAMPIGRRTVIARRILLAAIAAAGFGTAEVGPGHAQSYPSKPIKLVLPYTPGSPNDVLARLVAPGLSSR